MRCRHYIPVSTSISLDPSTEHLNIVEMVKWAEENPYQVAMIVDEARRFADLHLSELGQNCYMARLLLAYTKLVNVDTEQPRNVTIMPATPEVWE